MDSPVLEADLPECSRAALLDTVYGLLGAMLVRAQVLEHELRRTRVLVSELRQTVILDGCTARGGCQLGNVAIGSDLLEKLML